MGYIKGENRTQAILFPETIGWLTTSDLVSIQDISMYPILVSRDKNCPYRKAALEFLNRNIITNYQLVEYDILEPILAGIENNSGIAVLPTRLKTEKMIFATDISFELKPIKIFLYMKTNKPKIPNNIQEFIHHAFAANHSRGRS